MLYEGLSRKHALRLLDDATNKQYYDTHKKSIHHSLYRDTFYATKFWPIISDNIKKTHQTLAYILRNQYRSASEIYSFLKTLFDINPSIDMTTFVQTILAFPNISIQAHFQDVYTFLIMPLFKKYSIFSPSLVITLYIDLLGVVVENYVKKNWRQKSNEWMNCLYKHLPECSFVVSSPWIHPFFKTMLVDELLIFEKMRNQHIRM